MSSTRLIDRLRDKIVASFNNCPVFFSGHIQDALNSAFRLSLVKNRRPLLIYIHHDTQMTNILSNKHLIEFLHENYVVWPWDITDEADRNQLIEVWEETFPDESLLNFSMEKCPMLIGVMRKFSINDDDASTSYQHEATVILEHDRLIRINEQLDIDCLFHELISFLDEFKINEQYLSPDFLRTTNLCWEIIFEIAQYLPLNDAITVFSMLVLFGLQKCHIKLPIDQPSNEFIKIILRKLKHEQIASLRLTANRFKTTIQLASKQTFTHVKSLTIYNLEEKKQIEKLPISFSNLTCFILRFNQDYNLRDLCKIFALIPSSTLRFEIHCPTILCSHECLRYLFIQTPNQNQTLQSFVLNIDRTVVSSDYTCIQNYRKCLLKTIIDFIRIMKNIHSIRIVVNQGDLETLLDIDEWSGLVRDCRNLEKIFLKIPTQFQENVADIQNSLSTIRENIQFHVKVN